MKAPDFWTQPAGLKAALLSPLAAVWTAVTRRRLAKPGTGLDIPVICVGNLNAGGTGKTPVVMNLMERLAAQGLNAHVVSRGYGGRVEATTRVVETRHDAAHVGDEPLLLSAFGPVWVSPDRAAGAMAAQASGADLVILDDGFQNPALTKTMSILVVDADVGFGNRRVIPAGPLREPVADGLARADVMVLIGPQTARRTFLQNEPPQIPVFEAELTPLHTGMDWTGLRVLAFAGIGRPAKFFNSLKAAGAELIETRAFGDHAPYRSDLLRRLIAEAKSKNAQLVTTEKDAVRLPPEFRPQVLTFPVRLRFEDDPGFDTAITQVARFP